MPDDPGMVEMQRCMNLGEYLDPLLLSMACAAERNRKAA
jgi:hypothetical protein